MGTVSKRRGFSNKIVTVCFRVLDETIMGSLFYNRPVSRTKNGMIFMPTGVERCP
jgi:hypothetical protein